MKKQKIIIYQVLTRVFGIQEEKFIPWGTIEENGVGKMSDFSTKALEAIRDLGISHIWYTGILHHAVIRDYSAYGITHDHPAVVKGRAGSPYAIKDYYNVDPDLADEPGRRMEEFEQLVRITHEAGLSVIIDIVPNHVARHYHSIGKPAGTDDFGQSDDTSLEYHRNNNFYYVPEKAFELPEWENGYQPLGGRPWPVELGEYVEFPAKWTGNDCRHHRPGFYDWYETVKLNYGVRPDGSHDFPLLPDDFAEKDAKSQYEFWLKQEEVPDTWKKMKEIALFWLGKGVDGFRFDMAEMVPVPFWSYLNAAIKHFYPDALLIAEVYQPHLYHDFLFKAKMDLLYDKVDLYDTLKNILTGNATCHDIFPVTDKLYQYSDRLLHFMENHDEDRIAGHSFLADARSALPAMVISACLDQGALMVYFGQETGEAGLDAAGFGGPGKTSIFDYIRVPKIREWVNGGKFDGGLLSMQSRELRESYRTLLRFCLDSEALQGRFYDLHRHNAQLDPGHKWEKLYVFARFGVEEKLLIVCNFDKYNGYHFRLSLYIGLVKIWDLKPGSYRLSDQLGNHHVFTLTVNGDQAFADLDIEKSGSLILKLEE
ncbi:MAG TPA: alpha-amylase family glycosyl hydrolase [Saprospiraceae bacterium]|nr:alpha-amylase family glycosyl hydrolase [Saprospiraceae bacterium]